MSIGLKLLRETLRDNFGGVEVREHKKWITVTFTQGGFQSADAAEAATNFFLRDQKLDFTAVGVNGDRVRLIPVEVLQAVVVDDFSDDEDDENYDDGLADLFGVDDDEEFDDEDIANLVNLIELTVAEAHEASQLDVLLTKKLDYEIEEFLTGNLSAALELLPESAVIPDDLKQVMVFAYLTGKWSSARMEDLPLFAEYFNNRFQFAAEQHGNG